METSKGRDNKKPLLNKKPLSKLEEGLDGFTYEQVLDAIEWSLHQIIKIRLF